MNIRDRAKLLRTAHSLIGPGVVFIASLALALPMLPAVPVFQDSGEFVTAAATLGIPHPSGYPLYVILGRLASRIPLGTIPWRVNVLSALSAAGAAAVMFVIARRAVRFRVPEPSAQVQAAIAGAILLAVTGDLWWSHAVFAKPYALHLLLLTLFLYAVVRRWEGGGRGWTVIAAFVFALSLANHLFLTLAFVPGIAVALVAAGYGKRRSWSWRGAGTVLGAFLLGCSPYALLWFRSDAPFSFGTIGTWTDLVAHVLRIRYGDAGFGGSNKFALLTMTGGTASISVFAVLLFSAAAGARHLWRSGRVGRAFLALLLGLAAAYPLIVLARGAGWSEEVEFGYRPFVLPGIAALAIAAAAGAGVVVDALVANLRPLRWPFLALLAALAAGNAFVNAPSVEPYRDTFAYRQVRAMLEPLPADAVLVVADHGLTNDTELFLLAELQVVGRFRPDVTVVSDVGIRPFFLPELPSGHARMSLQLRRRILLDAVLEDPALRTRPIYATFPPEGASPRFGSSSNGIVFGLLRPGVETPRLESPDVPVPPERTFARNYALRGFVSHALYNRASLFADLGEREKAYDLLESAIRHDPLPMSPDYLGFVARRDAARAYRSR